MSTQRVIIQTATILGHEHTRYPYPSILNTRNSSWDYVVRGLALSTRPTFLDSVLYLEDQQNRYPRPPFPDFPPKWSPLSGWSILLKGSPLSGWSILLKGSPLSGWSILLLLSFPVFSKEQVVFFGKKAELRTNLHALHLDCLLEADSCDAYCVRKDNQLSVCLEMFPMTRAPGAPIPQWSTAGLARTIWIAYIVSRFHVRPSMDCLQSKPIPSMFTSLDAAVDQMDCYDRLSFLFTD